MDPSRKTDAPNVVELHGWRELKAQLGGKLTDRELELVRLGYIHGSAYSIVAQILLDDLARRTADDRTLSADP
jgi:hypothetical protein